MPSRIPKSDSIRSRGVWARAAIAATLLTCCIAGTAMSNEYWTALGDDVRFGPVAVLRFEVVDSETQTPIRNALITMHEGSTNRFTLTTDRAGVGIVLFMDWGVFPSGKAKVVAQGHLPWEEEIEQWDYYKRSEESRLYILGMENDWSSTDRPVPAATARALCQWPARDLPAGSRNHDSAEQS
jgi:hypothetical protein